MIHCDCEAKVFDLLVQGKRDWFTAANEFSYTDTSLILVIFELDTLRIGKPNIWHYVARVKILVW